MKNFEIKGRIMQANNKDWLDQLAIVNEEKLRIVVSPKEIVEEKEKVKNAKLTVGEQPQSKGGGLGLFIFIAGVITLLVGILGGGVIAIVLFVLAIVAGIFIKLVSSGVSAALRAIPVTIAFELETKEWLVVKAEVSQEDIDAFSMHYSGNPFSQDTMHQETTHRDS